MFCAGRMTSWCSASEDKGEASISSHAELKTDPSILHKASQPPCNCVLTAVRSLAASLSSLVDMSSQKKPYPWYQVRCLSWQMLSHGTFDHNHFRTDCTPQSKILQPRSGHKGNITISGNEWFNCCKLAHERDEMYPSELSAAPERGLWYETRPVKGVSMR